MFLMEAGAEDLGKDTSNCKTKKFTEQLWYCKSSGKYCKYKFHFFEVIFCKHPSVRS